MGATLEADEGVLEGWAQSLFLPDEREAVQKKTFTKWVNSHLARVTCRVGDLYSDLRDGRNLLRLLEVLSGETLVSWGDGWKREPQRLARGTTTGGAIESRAEHYGSSAQRTVSFQGVLLHGLHGSHAMQKWEQ